jgi:hypothetical protein
MPGIEGFPAAELLSLLRLEKGQEGGVLCEKRLDLRDTGAGPILDPRLAEIVLDAMQTTLTHPFE